MDDEELRLEMEAFYKNKTVNLDTAHAAYVLQELRYNPPSFAPKSITYFLTITCAIPKQQWYTKLLKLLGSKQFIAFDASIEHIQSNIHCHVKVITKYANLSKDKFKAWYKEKNGLIDIRRILKDNGIQDYQSKENPSFNNLREFDEYYKNKIFDNSINNGLSSETPISSQTQIC